MKNALTMILTVLLLSAMPMAANAQETEPDAFAILNQVRDTYQQLEGYHFEHTIITEELNAAGETVEMNERTLVTASDLATPPRGGKPGLSFNKKRFRMEVRTDRGDTLMVCNEQAAWRYQSVDKLYSKGRSAGDLMKALWAAMYMGSHMTPFVIVAEESIQDAKILREETVTVGEEQRDCYVIEASLKPDADNGAMYSAFGFRFLRKSPSKPPPENYVPTRTTLWIDKERSVIARRTATATRMIKKSQEDSEEKLPGEEVQCSLKDTFTVIRLGSPLPDELFSFTPPPDAKETPSNNARLHRRLDEWKALYKEAQELRQAGKYDEAVVVAKEALEFAENKLFYPFTATSMNNLALLYSDQGKYTEAEPLYKRALAMREKHSGPAHLDLIPILSNLADLYRKTGREQDAEVLEERVTAIRANIEPKSEAEEPPRKSTGR